MKKDMVVGNWVLAKRTELKWVMVPPSSSNCRTASSGSGTSQLLINFCSTVGLHEKVGASSLWTTSVYTYIICIHICFIIGNDCDSLVSIYNYLGEGDGKFCSNTAHSNGQPGHNIYVSRSPCQFDPAPPFLSGMGNWHVNLFQPRIFLLDDSKVRKYNYRLYLAYYNSENSSIYLSWRWL